MEFTEIRSRSELVIQPIPQAGAIAVSDWKTDKGIVRHYSLTVGLYENAPPMVYECGKGLGDDPVKGKGGCGYRILGSSPSETIVGYHVLE